MLTLDLHRLEREGGLRLQAVVPEDHVLWEGSELSFAAPLEVDLEASSVASGGVWVHGTISGRIRLECRRCLEEVELPLEEELSQLFRSEEDIEDDEDGEVRPIAGDGSRLDVSEAVREEVILAAPPYAVCKPDCQGLCPQCGANRNEETCECVGEDADPRWDALRALKNE